MMTNEEMLTRLVAQAESEGSDLVTLRAIVEEASEMGAARAVDRLGLADDDAMDDVNELRELLQAWRDAKASAWKSALEWAVRAVLALLLVGIAYRLGLADWVR